MNIAITALSPPDSPRLGGTDPEHVRALAETDERLPAITVHRSTMRVIDGMHRVRAALQRGESHIDAVFFEGSEADAFVLAVKSNVSHGLPLPADDRVRAAERIIESHSSWSDRTIASVSGLAAKTVASIRQRLSGDGAAPDKRVGRDGRVRPVNSAEGRRRAGKLIGEKPDASLREIADGAGIAVATARDVRQRVRAGEDPVPPQQRRTEQRQLPADEPFPELYAVRIASNWQNLKRDPSLRYSQTGRTILRLMDPHTMSADNWQQLVDNVPSHCADAVADLARLCAEALQCFAQQVDERQQSN